MNSTHGVCRACNQWVMLTFTGKIKAHSIKENGLIVSCWGRGTRPKPDTETYGMPKQTGAPRCIPPTKGGAEPPNAPKPPVTDRKPEPPPSAKPRGTRLIVIDAALHKRPDHMREFLDRQEDNGNVLVAAIPLDASPPAVRLIFRQER